MHKYGKFSAELEDRQRTRLNRVLAAIDEGHFWTIVKAELARDYHSLFDTFLRFEKDVDSNFDSHSEH